VEVPDTYHHLILEEPARFAGIVRAFLGEL
jgi:pimeloyl-ACP methyl ester carboxylesterase